MKNARFWIWLNDGLVKLTLKPGQELVWFKSWRHDEGWSSEIHQWTYDEFDGVVVEDYGTDGVDCDGRLSTSSSYEVPVDRLAETEMYVAEGTYGPMPAQPDWCRKGSFQRDYSAEAMGY